MNKNYQKIIFRFISIALSFLLWVYVYLSEDHSSKKEVHLYFKPPIGKAISKISSNKVLVEYSGPRAFLKSFFNSDQKIVEIDLGTSIYRGHKDIEFTVSKDIFPKPFKVKILSVIPEKIKLSVEREIKKNIPISIESFVGLNDDLRLLSKKLAPQSILIKGPISIMRTIGQIKIPAVDLSEVNGKGDLKIKLPSPHPLVNYEKTDFVNLAYDVRPKKANIKLQGVKVHFLSLGQNFKSKVRRVNVYLLAPEGRNLHKEEVQIIAELPEGRKGTFSINLDAKLPRGIHLLQIEPKSISVVVK